MSLFRFKEEFYAGAKESLKYISVGANGEVWGVNSAGHIYRYLGNNNWQHINGNLKQIAVGPSGEVWGVNNDDDIFRYLGNSNWQHIGGKLKKISIGPDGEIWGINNNQILCLKNLEAQLAQAQSRFNAHHFTEQENIDERYKSVLDAINAVDKLDNNNLIEKEHYRQLLVKALNNLKISMKSACDRFKSNNFEKQKNIDGRYKLIISAICKNDNNDIEDPVERGHYVQLLICTSVITEGNCRINYQAILSLYNTR